MKSICKKKGCTINDYISALLGLTLNEYFLNNDIPDKKGKIIDNPQ
jgi:hypothetical protein